MVPDPEAPFPDPSEGDGPCFVPGDAGFLSRNSLADALLAHWLIVTGTGSWLEAHLTARLGRSMGLPNLRGCGISEQEVMQLVQRCGEEMPLLVILSDSIAADQGRSMIRRLRRQRPDGQFLLLVRQERSLSDQALRACWAQAIVHVESFGSGTMIQALKALRRGQRFVDPRLLQQRDEQGPCLLTAREQQTLVGLTQGRSNREIAQALGIAPATVRDYVSSLCRKLAATNRTEVVTRALALGVIPV